MNSDNNYYEILDIDINASFSDINKAYHKAKTAYGSNGQACYSLMSEEESKNWLDLIEEAFSILKDSKKRHEYNNARFPENAKNFHLYSDNTESKKTMHLEKLKDQLFQKNMNNSSDAEIITNINAKEQEEKNKNTTLSRVSSLKPISVKTAISQNKFQLTYTIDSEMEKKIEATTTFTGPLLKEIREYKNVDLVHMCDMTKVSKMYIKNIEEENIEKLPALVYVRGFVFQYAKCLKLEPTQVASSYLDHIKSQLENNIKK